MSDTSSSDVTFAVRLPLNTASRQPLTVGDLKNLLSLFSDDMVVLIHANDWQPGMKLRDRFSPATEVFPIRESNLTAAGEQVVKEEIVISYDDRHKANSLAEYRSWGISVDKG